MSGAAWSMLAGTWIVVIVFTLRFFWKVLTLPPREEDRSGPPRT